MKVKLTYFLKHEIELEMPPEEYCKLRADSKYNGYFQEESVDRGLKIDVEGFDRLDEYFGEKEGKENEG